MDLPGVASCPNYAGGTQARKVLRQGRHTETDMLSQFADGHFAFTEMAQHHQPVPVGQGL